MAITSPLGNLFLAIQKRLNENVPALNWIDQNFGQLNNYEVGYKPPVVFPCALIDLTGFVFEDITDGQQYANGRVVISVSTTPFSNSQLKTPAPFKEMALLYYEIENTIHKALHGWQPTGFNKLLRRAVDKQEREDTIRERVIVFECSYTDTTAIPAKIKVPRPNPVVGKDIK